MTCEEAAKTLEQEKSYLNGGMEPVFEDFEDALDMAISALRVQKPNDWICTLKCKALMDGGICEHGGLCCLYESQRAIEENAPLTLDELREMDGEPVYIWYPYPKYGEWVISDGFNQYKNFTSTDNDSWYSGDYGKVWIAYRHKPEEGTE